MANVTFHRDSNSFGHGAGHGSTGVGAYVGEVLQAMGPLGRRLALTAFGGVLALSLGAATASAFRLPSEVTDPGQPQDQALAQSELPSEAAARAYALENPPVYTVAADHADATPTLDVAADTTTAASEDAQPTPAVAYTGATEEADPAAKTDADAPSPAAAATPAADTSDAG